MSGTTRQTFFPSHGLAASAKKIEKVLKFNQFHPYTKDMNLIQLSDKLILPVLANKSPEQQRDILLALRKESGLRAQVWIDQQLKACALTEEVA